MEYIPRGPAFMRDSTQSFSVNRLLSGYTLTRSILHNHEPFIHRDIKRKIDVHARTDNPSIRLEGKSTDAGHQQGESIFGYSQICSLEQIQWTGTIQEATSMRWRTHTLRTDNRLRMLTRAMSVLSISPSAGPRASVRMNTLGSPSFSRTL